MTLIIYCWAEKLNLAEDAAQITNVCVVSISQRAFQSSYRVSVCFLSLFFWALWREYYAVFLKKDAKQVYLYQEIEAQEASRNVSLCPLSTLSFFLSTWNINPSGVCILLVFNVHVKKKIMSTWVMILQIYKKGRWKDSEFL